MRVINVSLSELETKVLLIGFEGENQITQVRIDAAEILTDHPNATPTLIAKPLFGFAYPVIVTQEGTDVVWEIDNSVLSFHGDGEIQLTFTEGTVIAKSYVGRIRIKRSLTVTGEAPDPIETWEQAATAKLAEVDAQIGELEDMVEAAEAAKDQAQDIVDDATADIQAAGAAQVQVVQAKGTEVLNSIPSDYTELSNDVTGLKGAISLVDTNAYNGFIEFGIPTLPTQDHLLPYKDIGSNNLPADSSTTMLIYDVSVKTGWKIHFTNYTGYKYFLKYWNGSAWANYKNSWYTEDFTFTEDIRVALYIRNTDGTALDDTDIETIIGRFKLINTVSALAGIQRDVEVAIDAAESAEELIAPVETTTTASRAYLKGEYLVYNSTLYEATSPIAQGGTITPGTNCAAVTVGDEVSAIKSALNNYFVFDCTDGYYIKTTGDSASNGESCITDYIDVVPGQDIKLYNLYVANSRAVCAYDANKVYVETVISGSTSTTADYTVPDGVFYIRATGAYGIPPKVAMVNISEAATSSLSLLNEFSAVKKELPRIDENMVNGFIEFGIPTMPTEEHLLPYKDIGSNNLPADNATTMLIYDVSVKAGWKIGLTNYTGYKYFIKYWNNNAWGNYKSGWYTEDFVFTEDVRIALYIRNTAGTDLNDTDIETIISRFKIVNTSNELNNRISDLEWKTEYDYGTDFINNFIPSSALQLPSYYSGFPLDITISRYGNLYGHNLVPSMFMKNNANGATYYVSPDGNDSNAGTSPGTPLKSIDTAVGKSDVNTVILLPGTYVNGTHFSSAISKEINVIGRDKVILVSGDTDAPMKFTAGCYVDNVIFYGGTSACKTELESDLCVFNRCVFTRSASADGLTALGGYYVLFDCIADDNMLDGFNYHANSSYKPQVIEIRCKGKLNGNRSNLTQNNGSTIHDTNSRIIRIGCEYSSCRGGIVADANNAFSVNIACKSGSTEAISETNRNGNYVVMGNAMMWLYDCASFGSPYDIIADTGYINTTETYQRESAVNGGIINRLT